MLIDDKDLFGEEDPLHPEDTGGQEDQAGEGDQQEQQGAQSVTPEQFKELQGKIDSANARNQELESQLAEQKKLFEDPEYLRQVMGEPEKETKPRDEEPNWDEMGPKEIAEYSRKKTIDDVKAVLKEALTPMQQNMQRSQYEMLRQKAADQISKAAAKYSDFWDYQSDMKRISKENPTLNADRVYKLAKMEKLEASRSQEEKKPAPAKPSVKPGEKHLSKEQAVDAAYDRAMEEYSSKEE